MGLLEPAVGSVDRRSLLPCWRLRPPLVGVGVWRDTSLRGWGGRLIWRCGGRVEPDDADEEEERGGRKEREEEMALWERRCPTATGGAPPSPALFMLEKTSVPNIPKFIEFQKRILIPIVLVAPP